MKMTAKLAEWRLGWKLYFFLYALIAVVFAVIITQALFAWHDYVDLAFFYINLAAIYGYAFNKRVGRPGFWKCLLWVYPVWSLLYQFVLPFGYDFPQLGMRAHANWTMIFPLGVTAVSSRCIYNYGFKSQGLWRR
ncbi:hypothetical protein EUZ85_05445 [Hahella sp. KA22]|uniref:hypothetical protein n=1 Tax=Hahella sp. KA22 TaxID=1628392 RepID=UPI000FDDF9CD|nr:hypothetical protein [Hahella sp. KA22]AZZ90186.1 hypothetical protein ENC22_02895 [Hahella sp. KA22]QAY53556.1 hypothetical protein EUZ85_05445 [Hahella sp. KA22]